MTFNRHRLITIINLINHSFYTKFLTANLLILASAAAVIIAVLIYKGKQDLETTYIERGISVAKAVSAASELGLYTRNKELLNSTLSKISNEEGFIDAGFYDVNSKVISSYVRRDTQIIPQIIGQSVLQKVKESGRPAWHKYNGHYYIVAPVYGQPDLSGFDVVGMKRPTVMIGLFLLELDGSPLTKRMQGQFLWAGLVAISFLIISGLLLKYLLKKSTQPITALMTATRQIAEGNRPFKPEVSTHDEFATLLDEFFKMLAALDKQKQDLTTLVKIIDKAKDVLVVTNREGQILYGNNAYRTHLETNFNDTDFIKKYYAQALATIEQEVDWTGEVLITDKKGSDLYFETVASSIITDVGEQIVFIMRNVSEKKGLEKAVIESQKLESLAHTAAGIAHDYNNILGGVHGAVTVLKKRVEDNIFNREDLLKYINLIQQQSIRGTTLSHNLLESVRPGKFHEDRVDLHKALKNLIAVCRETFDRKITIMDKMTAANAYVIGDIQKLSRVFNNLFINSRDAMPLPQGGIIKVSTSNPDNNSIQIVVYDTGVGIPEDVIPRIFEPLFSTKGEKGTGVGLSAALGIIKNHGGDISVESNAMGTIFSVTLPLAKEDDMIINTTLVFKPTAVGKKKVLFIDDEECLRMSVTDIMTDAGLQIVTAANGVDGLALFNQHNDIGVIILDLNMPQMNGSEFFNIIKESDPEIPVVITTGYEEEKVIKDMTSKGFAGFIRKPYDINTIVQVASEILAGGGGVRINNSCF